MGYEAGPTGFVLDRDLNTVRVRYLGQGSVLTPAPHGGQVKTDTSDALHLVRLLKLVRSPGYGFPRPVRKQPGT